MDLVIFSDKGKSVGGDSSHTLIINKHIFYFVTIIGSDGKGYTGIFFHLYFP